MAPSVIVPRSYLPSGPGQIGVFEYSVSLGLVVFGIQLEDGIFIGAFYHVLVLGTLVMMALCGLVVSRVLPLKQR
jgi:hypothetical protein